MIDYGYGVDLRRLAHADEIRTFDMRNNHAVYYWCRQYAPLHRAKHAEWFEWQAKDPHTEMFAIGAEAGFLIGVCGLTSIDYINSRAEFSCYIDPNLHGKGYGTAALKTLFQFGFHVLGLNRIWGESFQYNPAIKLFTNLGMEHEGIRREFYYRGGRFIDAHLFSISRSTFDKLYFLASDPESAKESVDTTVIEYAHRFLDHVEGHASLRDTTNEEANP